MIGESITVVRLGTPTGDTDDQGYPILSPDTTFTISGVAPAPGTFEEQAEQYGARSEGSFTLYRRGDLDLRADDRVTFRGDSGWQVVGDARRIDWVSPYSNRFVGSVAEIRKAS